MSNSRLEGKVGLFVFVGLALLAALLLQFSKGISLFNPGYKIQLRAHNVAGLKPRAQVLMSGVQIGRISDIELAPDGKSVIITLRIQQRYHIYKDARFVIEQAGFLGDQFVSVRPTGNEDGVIPPGAEVQAEAPLDMHEVARSAARLLTHIDAAATNINAALADARQTILSAAALTNLSASFSEIHEVSQRSLSVMENLDAMVETNRHVVVVTLSNLLFFSEQINDSVHAFRALLATNAPEVNSAVKNIEASSATLKSLLEGVQQGKGLAGKLLVNEEIPDNVSEIVRNLSITTSNLNRRGLWGILWSHKPPSTNTSSSVSSPLTAPKNPFD